MSAVLHRDRATGGARLLVDIDAVMANVRTFRRTAQVPVMAVVKADGFGCGAARVARAAIEAGAEWLGTTQVEHAEQLRRLGFHAPLLSWLNAVDADWDTAVQLQIDVAIPSRAHLEAVALAGRRAGRRARVHLHADTGMARHGAPRSAWRALVHAAAAHEDAIEVVALMGHLPTGETPDSPATQGGIAAFHAAIATACDAGVDPPLRHLAATEAALRTPNSRFDLVRIGGGLVGIGPDLQTAATLQAPVTMIRRVPAGTSIGYGSTVSTERETVIATVLAGYADGVPRQAVGAEVEIEGRRHPLIGPVSMDQTTVDVGPRGCSPDATATFFGPAHQQPSLTDWARWAGTIERDIQTGIGARVRREDQS